MRMRMCRLIVFGGMLTALFALNGAAMAQETKKDEAAATAPAAAAETPKPEAAAPAEPPKTEAPPTPAPLKVEMGDTAWMIVAAALVMLMTPGLGFFYGGMVRRKNVLATFQHSFIALAVITLQWVLFGYSLAFGPDKLNGFIGGLEWAGLRGVGLEPDAYAPTIPHQLFMVYQLMFAIITPALISGAFAERMKFSAYLAFIVLWSTFVYDPVAHWVWGRGGLISTHLGALDFAGGLVVHLISGVAALCCVLTMGRRKGLGEEEMHPHNLTMTALGTALLWFGWFGFNAGSALSAGGLAVAAFVNTHVATAAATMSWVIIEWAHKGKATVLGACSGAVAGLVAITPACGFVSPTGAIILGLLVSPVCYTAIMMKSKLGYDDSLDVVGVHGAGGAFGALAVGFLAVAGINGSIAVDGLVQSGSFSLLKMQAASVLMAGTYSFVVTFVLLKLIDVVIGLRVPGEEEEVGLDLTQHGERGYIMGVGELLGGVGHSSLSSYASPPEAVSHPVADHVS